MGIEMQSLDNGVKPNEIATFTFNNPVYAYALGIKGFYLGYKPGTDHWIQDLSVRLLPLQPATEALTGNEIQAQVVAQLSDSSGNTIDIAQSYVCPVCIAVTGEEDPKTVMTVLSGIANGQQASVSLPGIGGFSILSSFLAGFTLDYSKGDHQVLGANAGCGIYNNQSQGFVTASASLYDASGNRADITNVDAGVIASIDSSPGFAIQTVTGQDENNVNVDFSSQFSSVSQAVCVLNSWTVKYYHAHDVLLIAAGVWGDLEYSGATVTLPSLSATILDNTNHHQDNAASNINALVIALP
jgi:hypothetical protein